jgi:hypothetical protein
LWAHVHQYMSAQHIWVDRSVLKRLADTFPNSALFIRCKMKLSRKLYYSLRSIILFANIDVSRHILVIDTSVLAKSNMDRRE